MRIQQIEVEGLQSYRDPQTIEIEGHPLLAAVGPNGGGKSTVVVDALIYAFWGQKRTRTLEEIITVGAPSVTVAINFYVGDDLYRVTRTTPRVGTTEGAVYAADDTEASGWRPISEKGSKETTAKVIELIGMTYEVATQTFIAEQGQYGKFAMAKPAERFALLSSVFQLDVYNERARKAKDKLSASESSLAAVEGSIGENEVVEEALNEPVVTAHSALDDDALAANLVGAAASADQVREQIAALAVGDPRQKAEEAQRNLGLLSSARNTAISTARGAVERGEQDAARAEQRLSQAKAAAQSTAQSGAAAAQKRFDSANRDAQANLDAATKALHVLERVVDELPAKQAELAGYESGVDEQTALAASETSAASESKASHAEFLTEWRNLDKQIADASKRIETLRLSLDDADHAKCFSCGQHLSPEDAKALMESQGRDIATWTERQGVVKTEGAAATTAVKEHEAAARQATSEATRLRRLAEDLRIKIGNAEQIISTRAERETALASAKVSGTGAAEAFSAESADIAATLKAAIDAADSEYQAAVATIEADLTAARAALAKAEEPSPELDAAQAEVTRLTALARDAEGEVARQRSAFTITLDAHLAETRAIEQEQGRRKSLEAQRKQVADRLVELRAQRSKIDFDRKYWSVLAKAYASTGIPAMLLGGITEELNEAIDVALERISLGELSILLTSQRETRGGTTENKVTVNVNTPEGPRAYESLSGGQKFRVDLAIRTGLTQVITRRTGTPIQTFILDEGWGTLDDIGIRSAIDTLTRLSSDYNVLTVSHIDAVRDAFPARIHVDRSTGTSIAEVMAA